ncbi:MAG: ilvB operon leader peptide IvbL, partial [Enterobacter hormaechei]|nr:ilvB operon leader peptide IvbL [Enterobacter hormaechei]
MKIFPLSRPKTCVCINSINDSKHRSPMTSSIFTSTLLKTAQPAAVVVVRVVVVVG